jgi:hypothetical protein
LSSPESPRGSVDGEVQLHSKETRPNEPKVRIDMNTPHSTRSARYHIYF